MSGIYHTGELSVQKKAGAEVVAQQNGITIKSNLFKGAIAFLKTQSFLIVASVDKNRKVWSSVLTGEPGFIAAEDEVTLKINAKPLINDPLTRNLLASPEVGLLVIDLSRRIRMRINGTGYFDEDGQLVVTTEQVFGNCPKYIQKRTLHPNGVYQRALRSEHRRLSLSPEQQKWIRNADTFFIGSISTEGKLDASHRGGSPGFVQVMDEKTLCFPDYFGNSMFNTLGNIFSSPSTGILFIDFNFGHSLQLTGQSEIIWDEKEIALFPGAERIVRFEVDEALYTENHTHLSWDFVEFSPANPTI